MTARRARLALFLLGGAVLGGFLAAAALDLPDVGSAFHPYAARAVPAGLAQDTVNIVSSVNYDQRAFDTVGEELILLAAALGTVVLLRALRDERLEEGAGLHQGPADVFDALRITGYLMLPVTLAVGIYVVAHGHLSPGGGFQGGVVLGTGIHLVYLAGDYPALRRLRPVPVFELAEALAAGAFVVLGLALTGPPQAVILLNAVVGVEVGCAVVLVLARFFEQALVIHR